MSKSPRKTPTGYETSIVNGCLYYEDCKQCHIDDAAFPEMLGDGYTKSVRVISLDYDWERGVWLDNGVRIVEQIEVQMTLRLEVRGSCKVWYAYRRVHGKLHKRYVGQSENVTQKRLLEIAKGLPSA